MYTALRSDLKRLEAGHIILQIGTPCNVWDWCIAKLLSILSSLTNDKLVSVSRCHRVADLCRPPVV